MNHLRTNFVVQTDSLLKKELSVGCFSLVVNKLLIVHTVSTIQYISYRSKWWFCYPNTRLAEIVQKAGKLPFGYPNGLLAKIMHCNLANKIKAQLSGKFPSAVPCSQLNIICEFTISVARLRILFIFCTHNIISVALSSSVIFSSLASALTSSENIFSACSSMSVRYESSLPLVSKL